MAWLGSISCFSRAGASPLRLFPSYANTRRRLLRMSSNCGNVCKNRIVTTSKNFKDLLKKVNTFNDADFTARKLLSNSWDAYVVNNLSFKISDKSFLWILQLFHQLCLQLFFSPSGRLAFVGGAVNVFLGVTSVIFDFPM